MRIGQIATLATPVRRDGAGSIEGMVWLLSRELVRLGHEVTLFAAAGSECDGELVATLPGPYGRNGSLDDWHLAEWTTICRAIELSAELDILHSHAYLWGLPAERLASAPMLHTTHILPGADEKRLWDLHPDASITAISEYQWSGSERRPMATIHHGVDVERFTFRAEPDDYLCYLGRFTWGKGPLTAITVALSLGMRIMLAGPRNEFYQQHIAPHVDDDRVIYLGGIGGAGRDRLLGGARALLYPIEQPEPFGLVLVEAMMCGTPVAAIGIGAVPEIVEEGVTGCCAASVDGLSGAVLRALALDRRLVRAEAERRFSGERMAREYAQVYAELLVEACR